MSKKERAIATFRDFELPPALLRALDDVGYETPSPIQAQAIPQLLQGLDLLGNAPTGTGKTAAFALPLLARLDLDREKVQVMVLTPTRELAIQVAEAFQRYAAHLPGFRVLPVYGGQDYGGQIRQLARGVHAVVGTPGRIMDHMRRGTLNLDSLQALVLDEADEMLRMGFIEDVEWILEQTPPKRQMALFSATMPREVQRIARHHLRDPQEITIHSKTATAETIRQRVWQVSGLHKLDALTRILEVEDFDALIIFVRTKIATGELADRLQARGLAAEALNGDMPQKQREQMIERLRRGSLDILVATDVAARGIDVERISHVVNYDIPYDTEAYIHRIGRTGRAGRSGEAILFVTPRETRMLQAIERATRQKIEKLVLPTTEMVNNKRIASFKQGISDTLAKGELDFMQRLVEQYQNEHDVSALEIAAALAKMSIGDRPLLLGAEDKASSGGASFERAPGGRERRAERDFDRPARGGDERGARRRAPGGREAFADEFESRAPRGSRRPPSAPEEGMERYRIDVGHEHGVRPANIVGAIANEAGLDSSFIGRIDIHDDHSLVDLPVGMPKAVFHQLRKAWVCQRKLNLTRVDTSAMAAERTEAPRARGPVMIDMTAESAAGGEPAFAAQELAAVTEPVRRDPDTTYTAGDRLAQASMERLRQSTTMPARSRGEKPGSGKSKPAKTKVKTKVKAKTKGDKVAPARHAPGKAKTERFKTAAKGPAGKPAKPKRPKG
ncbi:MAG: DEAD/DEAH box helicase [Burkholderiaceae bacterium]